MVSRRGYLTAIGTGCLAGVAGCSGILSSNSDGEESFDALHADPAFERFVEETGAEIRTVRAQFWHTDVAALREQTEHVADFIHESGNAHRFESDAMAAAIDTYDETATIQINGDLTDDRYVYSGRSFIEGTIQPAAFEARPEIQVEPTEYSDYSVFDLDGWAVALNDSRLISRVTDPTRHDDSDDSTAEEVLTVQSTIDALEGDADPVNVVDRGLEALRPYDTVWGQTGRNGDEITLDATSYNVHGAETTVRSVFSVQTEAELEEEWNRDAHVSIVERDYEDPDVSVDVDDTVAVVKATVSTANTWMAPED